MTKPYTVEEIRAILKIINITQIKLGNLMMCSRQNVYNFLNGRSGSGKDKHGLNRFRLYATYILNDYIQSELHCKPDDFQKILKDYMEEACNLASITNRIIETE